MSSPVQRKLTTILAADAEGYSRVMETDEVGALQALRAGREVFARFIERHHGRIANTAGDGLIAEFPSVVEAVQCAIEVQHELGATQSQSALRFRIGVHLGDVIVDGDDLLGEGVNLAARLQSMAPPGGILISRQVYDQVQKKLSVNFAYLGEKQPKNFAESVAVYSVETADATAGDAQSARVVSPPLSPEPRAGKAPKAPVDLRSRSIREGAIFAGIFLVMFVADMATGGGFWSRWPGIVLALVWGLRASPLFATNWLNASNVRLVMIILFLAAINAFTWDGTLWVIWPAGGILLWMLFGMLRSGSR